MQVDRIADGLWRWTAPHPAWSDDPASPYGGWEREVACVYHEAPDGILLIDPLVPEGGDEERFWRHLDQDVERVGGAPTVAVTTAWHGRSADRVRARYAGAQVLGVSPLASCRLDALLEDGQALPGGCRVTVAELSDDGRMAAIQCACHGMLWLADLLIGGPDGLRRPPRSWFDAESDRRWLEHGLPLLVPHLMELPIEVLIPAHGPVVVEDARAALQAALDRPLA